MAEGLAHFLVNVRYHFAAALVASICFIPPVRPVMRNPGPVGWGRSGRVEDARGGGGGVDKFGALRRRLRRRLLLAMKAQGSVPRDREGGRIYNSRREAAQLPRLHTIRGRNAPGWRTSIAPTKQTVAALLPSDTDFREHPWTGGGKVHHRVLRTRHIARFQKHGRKYTPQQHPSKPWLGKADMRFAEMILCFLV